MCDDSCPHSKRKMDVGYNRRKFIRIRKSNLNNDDFDNDLDGGNFNCIWDKERYGDRLNGRTAC